MDSIGDWRGVALVMAAAAAAAAALWPAAASIAGNWAEIHDYQHGFLIAPLALIWLLSVAWRNRSEPLRPAPIGLAALALALAAWTVGFRASSDIAIEVLLPVAIWSTILAAGGWRIAREAAAPIAYLYFAIPIWEFLLPALQRLSVNVTEAALALAGIPARVTEYLVTLPAGSFEIVEGCSGKRYFVVALAVSVLAGVLNHFRGWRLAALIAIGGALALVANWVRIFVVIAAGHATDMQHYLVAVEHRTFGNVVFVLLLVAIYFAAILLARWRGPAAAGTVPAAATGAHALREGFHVAFLAPFLLLGTAGAVSRIPVPEAENSGGLGPLPVAAGAWQGPLPPMPAWSPRFTDADAERRASYRRASGGVVQLYLNFYRFQRPGKELVQFRNQLLTPGPWSRVWPQRFEELGGADAPRLASMEARSPSGERWLLAYVYKVGHWTTTRAPVAQASYGLQSLLRPAPSGIVVLSVQCGENCQDARALVRVFWQEMSSSILGMIADDPA